jgi:hypothetical protein
MLSGRGLCDGLITRPEESYRLWRVVVCDQETSKTKRIKARYRAVENTTIMGCNARKTNKQQSNYNYLLIDISHSYLQRLIINCQNINFVSRSVNVLFFFVAGKKETYLNKSQPTYFRRFIQNLNNLH